MINIDNEWGSPTDENTCDCGATVIGSSECDDCRDEYDATIDWVTR